MSNPLGPVSLATTSSSAATTTTTTSSSGPTTTSASSSAGPTSTSASSSSASSVTSSSSSLSTSSTSAAASTTSAPTSVSSVSQIVSTDSSGNVFTSVSIVYVGPTGTPTPKASGGLSTAAIAAISSVAGIVALGLLFICVTNGLRRRRAKQFDDDVAEAAAVAANAHAPVFDDEVYHTSAGGYSDYQNAGAYNQPPMSHYTGDSYAMSEVQPYNMYAGDAMMGGGGAGVGVGAAVQRARSRRDLGDLPANSMAGYDTHYNPGYGEHASPYPAFAGPPGGGGGGGYRGPPNNTEDLLAAAGMAGMGGTAGAGVDRRQSANRNRYSGQNYGPVSYQNNLPPHNEFDDPYGGYDEAPAPPPPQHQTVNYPATTSLANQHSPQLVNPHSPNVQAFAAAHQADVVTPDEEDRYSDEGSDEEDGGRVLKVANE